MSRLVQTHFLENILPPFTNRNVEYLRNKVNFRIQQKIRESKFYMLLARGETVFTNCKLDASAKKIYVEISVAGEVKDSGYINTEKINENILKNYPLVSIKDGAILLQKNKKSDYISWLTPDSIYWNKSRGVNYLEGFDNWKDVCNYELLYVGISTKQDAYERLIKKAHHKRLDILSQEPQRHKGAHLSDEIIIMLFDIDFMSIHQMGSEDYELYDGVPIDRVIKDCEKAFVHLMDPKYNEVKFKSYPKGDDGLYNSVLDAYLYSINENIILNAGDRVFKGFRNNFIGVDNGQDYIIVERDRVEFHIG